MEVLGPVARTVYERGDEMKRTGFLYQSPVSSKCYERLCYEIRNSAIARLGERLARKL